MSYIAHFKGGPLNGTTRAIPSPAYELYFPMVIQASWKEGVDMAPSVDMHTAVYAMKGPKGNNEFQYEFYSITCPNEATEKEDTPMSIQATFSSKELRVIFAALGRVSDHEIPGTYAVYERVEVLIEKDEGKQDYNDCRNAGK